MTHSRVEHDDHMIVGQGADRLAEQAMDCLLALLRQDDAALIRDSASFLELIENLWEKHHIEPHEVWRELEARMDLSEELLKRGIRARKGGRYRSTKLP